MTWPQSGKGMSFYTNKPLGIGGLLSDAMKTTQLIINSSISINLEILLQDLLTSALLGLKSYEKNNTHLYPAEYRLSFREIGASIGIKEWII